MIILILYTSNHDLTMSMVIAIVFVLVLKIIENEKFLSESFYGKYDPSEEYKKDPIFIHQTDINSAIDPEILPPQDKILKVSRPDTSDYNLLPMLHDRVSK